MVDRFEREGGEAHLYEGGPGDSERHAEIRSHYESFFDRDGRELTWALGPASYVLPGFRVLEIPPNRETALWTYASIGAFLGARHSSEPVEPMEPAEFLLMMPEPTGRGVELVTMVARYHASHPLAVGDTLPIGAPLLAGARCDAFLISRPHPFEASLERAPLGGRDARIHWLLPITPEERRFAKAHGADALEAEFERAPVQYWVPGRTSVVG